MTVSSPASFDILHDPVACAAAAFGLAREAARLTRTGTAARPRLRAVAALGPIAACAADEAVFDAGFRVRLENAISALEAFANGERSVRTEWYPDAEDTLIPWPVEGLSDDGAAAARIAAVLGRLLGAVERFDDLRRARRLARAADVGR